MNSPVPEYSDYQLKPEQSQRILVQGNLVKTHYI